MKKPIIKGWCPGAHRPMMSGDGLVVRVRPFRSELTAAQALGLCDVAERFGSGMLDLTSRANIQIRGVSEADHTQLVVLLDELGLIDDDAAVENKRNILMPHTWQAGDLTDRLYSKLLAALPDLPELPGKMGFALDTGFDACLQDGSADFRFELDAEDRLMLRADGCASGRLVSEGEAIGKLRELAQWFVSTGGLNGGRMSRHIEFNALPREWTGAVPRTERLRPDLGPALGGTILGAPFGKIKSSDLRELVTTFGVISLRLMLNRMIFAPNTNLTRLNGFLTKPSSIMKVHACPGAPFCQQATIDTLETARKLAPLTDKTLHVSGCAKGCAFPKRAAVTLVGRDGQFDLVPDGRPWDDPVQTGIDPIEYLQKADVT